MYFVKKGDVWLVSVITVGNILTVGNMATDSKSVQ